MLNNIKLEMTLERRVQWHAQRRDSINAAMCECVVDDLLRCPRHAGNLPDETSNSYVGRAEKTVLETRDYV